MNRLIPALVLSLAALTACSPQASKDTAEKPATSGPVTPKATPAPAGLYTLDKAHTSVNFRVNHMGVSHFTARFTRIDGTLQIDPAHPEASVLKVSIDPKSIQTNYPDKAYDFDGALAGKEFLDAGQFPQMTFASTKVEITGADTAKVTGDFTMHGVTRPVVLETTFNGGYAPGGIDPAGARIGFSAKTTLKRSDFGISMGIPAPGTSMGVSDEVEVAIETEFTKK